MKNLLTFILITISYISYSQGLFVKYSDKITYPDNPEDNFEVEWSLYLNNNRSLYTPISLFEDKNKVEYTTNEEGQEGKVITNNYFDYKIPYKNYETKEQVTIIHKKGVDYKIKEPLETFEWTITEKTKKIGEYTARLATTTRFGLPVDVWYTEEIPFSAGPAGFHGLPGLILEYSLGFKTVVAVKIDFNFNGKIEIPEKGTFITRENFEILKRESSLQPQHTIETTNEGNISKTTSKTITVETRKSSKKN